MRIQWHHGRRNGIYMALLDGASTWFFVMVPNVNAMERYLD